MGEWQKVFLLVGPFAIFAAFFALWWTQHDAIRRGSISLRYICELDVLQLPRYRVELVAGSVTLARDSAHGDWVKWGDVMLLLDGHRYATDAEAREAGQRMMAKHRKALERLAQR